MLLNSHVAPTVAKDMLASPGGVLHGVSVAVRLTCSSRGSLPLGQLRASNPVPHKNGERACGGAGGYLVLLVGLLWWWWLVIVVVGW